MDDGLLALVLTSQAEKSLARSLLHPETDLCHLQHLLWRRLALLFFVFFFLPSVNVKQLDVVVCIINTCTHDIYSVKSNVLAENFYFITRKTTLSHCNFFPLLELIRECLVCLLRETILVRKTTYVDALNARYCFLVLL